MKHFYRCFLGILLLFVGNVVYGMTPNGPSGLTLDFDLAAMKVTGTVIAPATADWESEYAPLEYLTKLVIERGENVMGPFVCVKTFDSPGLGATLSFTDTEIEAGKTYTYRAIAYVDNENSNEYACTRTLFTGIIPGKVTDLHATMNNGMPPVTISFKIPKVDDDGAPLTVPVVAAKIARNENFGALLTLAEITEFGEDGEVVYVDNTAEEGHQYTYYATASTEYAEGTSVTIQVKIDVDVPAAPTNLNIVVKEKTVELTWDAPVSGNGGGYIDPEETVYSVRRIINGVEDVELVSNLKATSYIDDISALTRETVYTYRVTPSNAQGTGSYVQQRDVVAGPPASLPYYEDFNGGVSWNKAPENNWESGTNKTWSNWGVSTSGYYGANFNSVQGANPEVTNDGYAWAQYTIYNDADVEDWYMSGRISMKEAQNPTLSFYAVQLPVETTSTLKIEIVDSEGKTTALETLSVAAEEYGWKLMSYSLAPWIGKDWIRVRFTSFTGETPAPVGFDCVSVSDEPVEHATQFISNGIRYLVTDKEAKEVSVIGYPGDDVNVVIPEKVVNDDVEYVVSEIADRAFYGMNELASVEIPGSVKRIGENAFWGNLSLAKLVIPEGVTLIDVGAFLYCSGLREVTLPESLTEIGYLAFSYCQALKSIKIPSGVTVIPNYAFSFCSALETVDLPSTLTAIHFQAFSQAIALKNIDIPESVTDVRAMAFEGTAIEKITIPAGLRNLMSQTFAGCQSLRDVTFVSDVPPTVDASAFNDIAQPCMGHCPEGTEDVYQSTPGLEKITFKQAGIDTIDAVNSQDAPMYNINGIRVNPQEYRGIIVGKNGKIIIRR